MPLLSPSNKNRLLVQVTRPIVRKPHMIVWGMLACVLLIVSAACAQHSATQGNHPTTTVADPTATPMIYLVTFTTSTTYEQAHELLQRLGLSVGQWDCRPRAEQAGKIASAAELLLTTPPPSQDTPEFFARNHKLIVGYYDTPTPQQITQLNSSPQVAAIGMIPLVSC